MRNFANKIWNASRFVLMNLESETGDISGIEMDISDKWILSRLNSLISEVTSNLDKFELGIAAGKLYEFIWNEFCDWYIEMTKPRLYGENEAAKGAARSVLAYVLKRTLALLHPFMPFVTEEIWSYLPGASTDLIVSPWPKAESLDFSAEAGEMERVMELIRGIRNIRAEMNVQPSVKTNLHILTGSPGIIDKARPFIEKLGYASRVTIINSKDDAPVDSVSIATVGMQCFIALGELVNIEKELARLEKELKTYGDEIKRVESKLANEGFVKKAPAHVVEEERKKADNYRELYEKTMERMKALGPGK